ncbi:hypothetical protein BBJ28_00009389 [Nothophytophthora sp. Chile5]|nr:hypothetical protein BBJ28_00009389 [Nothophytophthora sp. Chile5]
MASRGREDFGLKKSSGVNYDQCPQHVPLWPKRSLTAVLWMLQREKPPAEKPKSVGTKVAAPQSATMDAFMRMVTGKEERTIADRISDPNRPTWEQYKKDNADKLDLSGNGEKEMKEYRKQKSHKRRRTSSASDSSDESGSDRDADRSQRRKRSKKSKKSSRRKDREASPSPVRLSSFLQQTSDESADVMFRLVELFELLSLRLRVLLAPMADDENRKTFMKLLRQGVQAKVQQQQQQRKLASNSRGESGLGALTSDPDSEVRRATLPGHKSDRCNGDKRVDERSVEAWQTLAWRDAFSMEPYFLETISGQPLRIKQVLQGELNGFGTGLTVWPAACVLLKHLEHRFATAPDCQNALAIIEKPFVLELGSGTGAVGIAAAMLLQAGRVVLTDMDNVQFIMQENANAAREGGAIDSQVAIDVVAYEWGKPPSERLIPPTGEVYPDLILISDCILPRLYPIEPLVEALALLSRAHTRILISYEHRHYQHFQPKHRFWELMQARSFALRVLDADEYHPHYRADDIEIWEVTPPSLA